MTTTENELVTSKFRRLGIYLLEMTTTENTVAELVKSGKRYLPA